MFDRLEFLFSEAIVSLRRNRGMTFASIIASSLALVIVGGFTLTYIGLSRYVAAQGSRFEMSVFARDDATPDQVRTLGDNIGKLDGVDKVTFKSKAEVWAEWKKKNPSITSGLELENPMPDTFIVTFKDLRKVDSVAKLVRHMPEVAPKDGVQLMGEVQSLLESVINSIRWLGIGLGIVTLLTGGILIYNTVRLTMNARRREIRIMELVGANRSTIEIPLLIEGVTHGVLGSLIATLVLWVGFGIVSKAIGTMPMIHTEPFPAAWTTASLALAGAAYGYVCGALAIRENQKEAIPR